MKIMTTIWMIILMASLTFFVFDVLSDNNEKISRIFNLTNSLFYIATIIILLSFIAMELFFGGNK